MKEDPFVAVAMKAASQVLSPPLTIQRGKALLYQISLDNRLELEVDPKDPKRGQSAFQTDLCVFETISSDTEIPRVVLEFKTALSTHDVLIYSSKARRHKQIYPYLRYGIVIGRENKVPGKFFTHNEGLDFCVAAGSYRGDTMLRVLSRILKAEVKASRELERISFGGIDIDVFRTEVVLEDRHAKVS